VVILNVDNMDIVIDFDGTCVTHEFPKIGKDIGAEEVLKDLIKKGHRLILFTVRSDVVNPECTSEDLIGEPGFYLTDAINWFIERDIPLYGIQSNPEQSKWTHSPKAYGQIYIDDAALGCPLIWDLYERPYVDWKGVRRLLEKRSIL